MAREFSGGRTWEIAALVVAAIVSAAAAAATHSLAGLVDEVVRKGPDSQLPAHLSVVLGLTRVEQKTAVKQAVLRDGETVRTFNVCSANHGDLVMLTHNDQSHSTKAYLVSAAGVLRKAIYYQDGGSPAERTQADAGKDFDAELKFWTDFSHPPAQRH